MCVQHLVPGQPMMGMNMQQQIMMQQQQLMMRQQMMGYGQPMWGERHPKPVASICGHRSCFFFFLRKHAQEHRRLSA